MKEKILKEYYRIKNKNGPKKWTECCEQDWSNKHRSHTISVIEWIAEEIKSLDRKPTMLLTKERTHHPKSDVDRI